MFHKKYKNSSITVGVSLNQQPKLRLKSTRGRNSKCISKAMTYLPFGSHNRNAAFSTFDLDFRLSNDGLPRKC